MSSWNIEDINGFKHCNQEKIGQINLDSELGKFIYKIASNKSFQNYLEIGTWNGLGSTKCFIEAFENRDNDFLFYSLECNTDKYEFANNNYKDMKNIYILNEVLLNNIPEDIYNIFPEILKNEDLNYWNIIDFDNMKCYSLKDCTYDQLENYFNLIYKSCDDFIILKYVEKENIDNNVNIVEEEKRETV